jgi:hypothetical protein
MSPTKRGQTRAGWVAFLATVYGLFVSAAVFWRLYHLYATNWGWQEGAAGIGILILSGFTGACGVIAFVVASKARYHPFVKAVIAIALLTLLLMFYLVYLTS